MLDQLRVALPEQVYQFHKPGMALRSALFENCRRAQRKQTDHGPDLQAYGLTVWHVEEVVVKAVLGVPHFIVVDTNAIHGISDPQKMLQKAKSNFLVHRG